MKRVATSRSNFKTPNSKKEPDVMTKSSNKESALKSSSGFKQITPIKFD